MGKWENSARFSHFPIFPINENMKLRSEIRARDLSWYLRSEFDIYDLRWSEVYELRSEPEIWDLRCDIWEKENMKLSSGIRAWYLRSEPDIRAWYLRFELICDVRAEIMEKWENEKIGKREYEAEIWDESLRSELISEIWVWYLRLELIWGIWAEIRARDLRFEMWYVEKWENEKMGEKENMKQRSEIRAWDLS